ncbi:MAG: hypothetical protein K9H84_06935 [Bacteroidales bacterium]|nr:hypothetical protein [Bacteroidales bacterium]
MKSLWLTFLFIISAFCLSAQDTLKTSDLPQDVKRNFERRNRNIDGEVWLKDSSNFVVTYKTRRGYKESKYYDKSGELLKTVQKQPIEEIRSNMMDYIDKNYRYYEPYEMYFIEKGRRNRYYSILMHHRKADDPPVTEIQFDQSGRFITIYNLYIPEEEKVEPEIDEDFAEQVDEEAQVLSSTIEERKVKKKNLPSDVLDYIEEAYPYPFRMKSSRLTNSSKGPLYIIKMKEQGDDFFYKLTFNYSGEIISDEKVYEKD